MAVKTTNAPELTAEQVAKILVQPLAERSQFLASGARLFDSAGPLRLPKAGAPIADPGWTGESELIPERDADFDEISLLPSTMKSIKVITRYSNELARQSIVALDAALKARLVSDVAAKVDAQLFSASGDGVTTPRGLFAWGGTQGSQVQILSARPNDLQQNRRSETRMALPEHYPGGPFTCSSHRTLTSRAGIGIAAGTTPLRQPPSSHGPPP